MIDINSIIGVISGVGKGIIGTPRGLRRRVESSLTSFVLSASSAGLLLKTLGLKVTAIKIDPYLNIDAGMADFLLDSRRSRLKLQAP